MHSPALCRVNSGEEIMSVLVTAASKHGSTQGIAEAIARELAACGVDARFEEIANVADLTDVDAVVIGSALYMGSWMKEAQQFVERHAKELQSRHVWLFSSGPVGEDPDEDAAQPRQLAKLVDATGAVTHRVFLGKLDASTLGPFERLVLKIVHAPTGDHRDWELIRQWADEIANALIAIALVEPSPK